MYAVIYPMEVNRWGLFEFSCKTEIKGNPFTDQFLEGTFTSTHEQKRVAGFYDGEGVFKVRFMPSFAQQYSFVIHFRDEEDSFCSSFKVLSAEMGNHGPVRVANTFHFAYEDGTPYLPIGTTCYVWELQNEVLQKQTLETLKESAFNKIRFCLLPKHYDYNLSEPRSYPYEGTPCDSSVLNSENFNQYTGCATGNDWDFSRFNVEHFQHIEKSILALQKQGIEADLIVMHPYDRWGFSSMTKKQDNLYWKYVLARFSAYRNVWWSLANEYDLMETKSISDWEQYAQLICELDPYGHLRSIHNCGSFYDYSRPWITHCSIQRQDPYKCAEYVDQWRAQFKKPIVLDEIGYEGNIQHGWGNLSGKELTRRFWEAACRGGYGGHGETFFRKDRILWWSHGGCLHGESPDRIKFLKKIMEETSSVGLRFHQMHWDELCCIPDTFSSQNKTIQDKYVFYYGFNRPSFRKYHIDDTTEFVVEVIDTWEMTIENRGTFSGDFTIELPAKEYMAVRLSIV